MEKKERSPRPRKTVGDKPYVRPAEVAVCLKCNRLFNSKDKTRNRICTPCQESNHNVYGMQEIHLPQPRPEHTKE